MARGKTVRILEEMIAEKRNQIARLQTEIATLESAIRRHNGEPDVVELRPRARRVNVKGTLLDLLKEVGPAGLNAARAVELAESRGEAIERNTVSSLLSRLKGERIVDYDGVVYRLKQFTPTKPSSDSSSGSTTSGGAFG